MKQKRYQFMSADGIKWTKWFDISSNAPEEPIQIKLSRGIILKNEYRNI